MACIYSNFQGECTAYDPDSALMPNGCKSDGICVVEEDPNPEDSCDDYQDAEGDGDWN